MPVYTFTVSDLSHPVRVDSYLSSQLKEYSRSQIQQQIKNNQMAINQKTITKARTLVVNHDETRIVIDLLPEPSWEAQKKNLDIVFEDEAMLVINKSAGDVVHPGSGNPDETILNGLIHHDPELAKLPRAGIIHRLDKDTTGLMIIAKQPESFQVLTDQLAKRAIHRHYEAIVHGRLESNGSVDQPIGRHPTKRIQMTVRPDGKTAKTYYDVLACFDRHSHIKCRLVTGRTHQIRVHMRHIKHPLVGDPVYHGGYHSSQPNQTKWQALVQQLNRQALHARHLALEHPITKEPIAFESPLPKDMSNILDYLRST